MQKNKLFFCIRPMDSDDSRPRLGRKISYTVFSKSSYAPLTRVYASDVLLLQPKDVAADPPSSCKIKSCSYVCSLPYRFHLLSRFNSSVISSVSQFIKSLSLIAYKRSQLIGRGCRNTEPYCDRYPADKRRFSVTLPTPQIFANR